MTSTKNNWFLSRNSLAQKTNENASVTMFIMADLTSTDKLNSFFDEYATY